MINLWKWLNSTVVLYLFEGGQNCWYLACDIHAWVIILCKNQLTATAKSAYFHIQKLEITTNCWQPISLRLTANVAPHGLRSHLGGFFRGALVGAAFCCCCCCWAWWICAINGSSTSNALITCNKGVFPVSINVYQMPKISFATKFSLFGNTV